MVSCEAPSPGNLPEEASRALPRGSETMMNDCNDTTKKRRPECSLLMSLFLSSLRVLRRQQLEPPYSLL